MAWARLISIPSIDFVYISQYDASFWAQGSDLIKKGITFRKSIPLFAVKSGY